MSRKPAETTPSARAPSLAHRLLTRLAGLYLLALVAAVAVHLAVGWFYRGVELEYELEEVADRVAERVAVAPDGRLALRGLDELPRLPGLEILVADPATGAPGLGSSPLLANRIAPEQLRLWRDAEISLADAGDGEPAALLVATRDTPAGPARIVLARGPAEARDVIDWVGAELVGEVLPLILPLSLATIAVGFATVRGGLRPLRRLSAQAAGIGPDDAGARLGEAGVPQEALPLVRAVNRALDRLDAAFRRQRRFAANAAHELRTPLAVLRARLDALDDRAAAAGLTRDAERMARIVDQLLDVARLEARRAELTEVDLVRVVRETLADLAPLALAEGKELELAAPNAPIVVRGDAGALSDALRNLLENALRVTPAGGAVETAVGADGAIEVRDRGPGVPAPMRERVFEPFQRGERSDGAARRGAGAGLGLAIVAETAALHGGSVAVSDRPGGGAVFRLTLPVAVRLA